MSRRWAAVLLMAAGAAGMILGVLRGEVRVIFMKAANICLECIGLG